jgi:hypothetical protein
MMRVSGSWKSTDLRNCNKRSEFFIKDSDIPVRGFSISRNPAGVLNGPFLPSLQCYSSRLALAS